MLLLLRGCWVWFEMLCHVVSFSISVHILLFYITCTLLSCVFILIPVSAWACFIHLCDIITCYFACCFFLFFIQWPVIITLTLKIRKLTVWYSLHVKWPERLWKDWVNKSYIYLSSFLFREESMWAHTILMCHLAPTVWHISIKQSSLISEMCFYSLVL